MLWYSLEALHRGASIEFLAISLDKTGYQDNIFLILPQKHVVDTH